MTPEGKIKRQILDWLEMKKIFHWVYQSGKVPGRRLIRTGVPDILGAYKGRLLAIEVKAKTGKVSDEQMEFIYQVRMAGGIAFVARCVEDVEAELRKAG